MSAQRGISETWKELYVETELQICPLETNNTVQTDLAASHHHHRAGFRTVVPSLALPWFRINCRKPPVITDSGIQAASPHLKIPVSESIPNRSVRNKFGAPRCTLATGHGSRLSIETGGRYFQSAEPPVRSVNSLLRVLNERGFDPREYNGLARLHVRPLGYFLCRPTILPPRRNI